MCMYFYAHNCGELKEKKDRIWRKYVGEERKMWGREEEKGKYGGERKEGWLLLYRSRLSNLPDLIISVKGVYKHAHMHMSMHTDTPFQEILFLVVVFSLFL